MAGGSWRKMTGTRSWERQRRGRGRGSDPGRPGCPHRGGRPQGARSLTLPGQLQPGAALPHAAGGGGRLAPVRFELLDLGLRDRVLGGPVEAAHGATVLVEGELQRGVALLRVQARLAAQGHSAGRGAAGLLWAQHPEHRRLEQLCGETTEAEDACRVRTRGQASRRDSLLPFSCEGSSSTRRPKSGWEATVCTWSGQENLKCGAGGRVPEGPGQCEGKQGQARRHPWHPS